MRLGVDCLLDLHTAAVHLDDLGSEGLDGSQYQLLVLQGSDAKAQYISVDMEIKIYQNEFKMCNIYCTVYVSGSGDPQTTKKICVKLIYPSSSSKWYCFYHSYKTKFQQ